MPARAHPVPRTHFLGQDIHDSVKKSTPKNMHDRQGQVLFAAIHGSCIRFFFPLLYSCRAHFHILYPMQNYIAWRQFGMALPFMGMRTVRSQTTARLSQLLLPGSVCFHLSIVSAVPVLTKATWQTHTHTPQHTFYITTKLPHLTPICPWFQRKRTDKPPSTPTCPCSSHHPTFPFPHTPWCPYHLPAPETNPLVC